MKELTQKENEMLFDYERKYGKEKADQWRQKLLDATPEEVEIKEIEETLQIPDFRKMKSWNKILKTPDAKAYLPFFVKIIEMCNDVNDLPDWHGTTFMLIRTPKNIVLIKKDTIAVNPDSEETILKGEDELPEDRVIMNEEEEDE
jgi:hypothetical protein